MQVPGHPPIRASLLAAGLALGAIAGLALAEETSVLNPTLSALSTPAFCGVIELRQYTLHPFKRDVLIDLFEREFVEGQETRGMRLLGTFRDLDDPDRFVWLRGFADMPARAEALDSFYSGPVWQAHRERANATMLDSDNVLLLKSARGDSGFTVDDQPLAPPGATAIPPGLVEARIYYFDVPPSAARIELLDAMRPALDAVGASRIATLVSEPAPNNFPGLPVREGEPVVVVLAQFRDGEAYRRYLAMLSATPRWRRSEGELLRGAPRSPDVLRLAPTARSRLPR